jgi:hypothetical protein
MEKTNNERRTYMEYVKEYLVRRHITEIVATLIWLRDQKVQSQVVKQAGVHKVTMEIGVLDEMIFEAENKEGK